MIATYFEETPMPFSTLDPQTALIVIDLQKGIVALPVVHPAQEIVARCCTLIEAFRARELPVVLVNVAGGAPGRTDQPRSGAARPADWADLVPELKQQPTDIAVTKRTWGAFSYTGLDARLRARGVTQVVIIGIATSMGVESTARQAHELGYNVTLVTDAMSDTSAEAHANSTTRIFPMIAETGTREELLELLPPLVA